MVVALSFQEFVCSVAHCDLAWLTSVVVSHCDFSHGELKDNIFVVKAGFHADIVRDKVPVRVEFRVTKDLPLS